MDSNKLRRIIYIINSKIKSTQWVLDNKNLPVEEQGKLEQQIEFDEEIIEDLEKMQEEE